MPKKLSVRTDGRTDRPTIIYKLEAQKLWMGIRRSRFKVYLLKSIIDLLEKINMKPCFILYDEDG